MFFGIYTITMQTVLITGGTGLIGRALSTALLDRGYAVIILTREKRPASKVPHLSYAVWDIEQDKIDEDAFGKADYIVHLAGAGVADKRWTKKRKQEIVDSRVKSGRILMESIALLPNKVKTLVSSSAIGWYGGDRFNNGNDQSTRPFVEEDPPANDFLGQTCEEWEDSLIPTTATFDVRLVILRTGIVLSKQGGALKEFMRPLKFGVATILGTGRQVVSWIHIDDLVRLYITAIENEQMNGVYNAVAPHPVSNKELILTLAKSRKKKFITMLVPSFILRIAMGGLSIEVLKSCTVSANKVISTGFTFSYPTIKSAFEQ